MKNDDLQRLCAEARLLDATIARDAARLKKLKGQITAEAKARRDEQTKNPSGGWSCIFPAGTDGSIARVIKTGRSLKSSIAADHDDMEDIEELAGSAFSKLFDKVVVYKPEDDFRDLIVQLLDKPQAADLLKLCTSPGKTSVNFETKQDDEDES